jgi:2-oxoglutarate dehydrogenase E2 component (dihydrolipoamide succinyltransferase)
MALEDLVMPKLGESIMEATILKWTKKVGEAVKHDETLLEIATDKVDTEVPSTSEGILSEILFAENDVVPVGAVIARVDTNSEEAAQPPTDYGQRPAQNLPVATENGANEEEPIPFVPNQIAPAANGSGNANNGFFSPLVLNIANSEKVPLSELENIQGTGSEGRVTKRDILQYVAEKKSGIGRVGDDRNSPAKDFRQTTAAQQIRPAEEKPTQQPEQYTRPDLNTAPASEKESEPSQEYTASNGNVEIIEMDRMRKMIAKHMVSSKQTSAHVTSFAEADVTNMVMWREKIKKQFEKQEGTRITFTPMFITCVTRVIKRYPYINCSIDGERIILKKDINIGMATALPTGNLIVPVIKNADHLNLVGLSKSVNTLADNARSNRLRPDDTADGTFTITNVGTFGSLMGTPIINQPQVAILAVGAIKKRAVVLETEEGDAIGIRHMMYLSLSYDHRVVDGSVGASFLTEVAKEFENWDPNRQW